jgi:hypothetical protein
MSERQIEREREREREKRRESTTLRCSPLEKKKEQK